MRTASWYHASLKPIGRSSGRSAVACVAYRTASCMTDERYAAVRDFSRKADVVTSFTLAPEGAPSWALDAEQLWNAVEAKESRKNSQVAFEWEVALPNELDADSREAIARGFSQWLVDEYGVGVTTGIHGGEGRWGTQNSHAHVMMTTREITPDGWARTKLRDFNARRGSSNPEVDRVREEIAERINGALEEAGSDERVDHRSFEARGIDMEPTKHLGPAAMALERTGRDGGDRADINRAIMEERLLWQLEQEEPRISPEIDAELSRRWEGWEPLQRGVDTAGAEMVASLEHGTPATTAEEHTGWRRFVDRVRAFDLKAKAIEFWQDETSGAPEAERGFAARFVDAGRKLFEGWHHHYGPALTEGLDDAASLVSDLEAEREGRRPANPADPPKTFAERVRDGAIALWRNERGMVPDDDFDRMAAEWGQAPPPDEGPPSTADPEPDHPEPDGPDIE